MVYSQYYRKLPESVTFIHVIPTAILHDASKEKHLHVHEVTGHSECCLFK